MVTVYGIVTQNLTVLSIVAIFCLSCWYYLTHRRVLTVARQLPTGVPTLPLLGHGYLAVHGLDHMMNVMYKAITRIVTQSVSVVTLWIGVSPMFLVLGRKEIEAVLTGSKALERGPEIEFGRFLGNGLLTAPGHVWKVTRRYLNPMFHARNIERVMPALNECARDLVDNLAVHVGSSPVDIYDYTFSVTVKSTCILLMGPRLKVDVNSQYFQDLMKAIVSMDTLLVSRFFKIWLWPEFLFQLFHKKDLKFIKTTLKNFLKEAAKIVDQNEKEDQLKKHFEDENSNKDVKGKEGSPAITLLEAYRELQHDYPVFTEQDLRNEIITLLLAGTETSKILVCSCLLALAANPTIQERLYREILSVVDVQNMEVTFENLKALTYLDQVVKETLRKFPSVVHVSRKAQEDIKLDGFTMPTGASMAILPFAIHMNPKYYPEPNQFNPDRFSAENAAQREKYTYMPFGSGPRGCIGKTYALTHAKTMVIHVLTNYKLSTNVNIDNVTLTGGVTVSRVGGYPMRLEKRS